MSQKHLLGLNSKSKSYVFSSRKKKFTKKAVLKMLEVMETTQAGTSSGTENAPTPSENGMHAQEFLSSGRTGRRNALPDILGQHAVVTSSDLPSRLQALSTTDSSSDVQTPQQSTSSVQS